ncbi:sulfotransferase domain-containing protein [Rhodopirellula sp. P2]|uniref:sulfotransferase domain-containing protein n=1 Tax=Rhodopirellula sp. P2 TaxID=2127060 RepID=UPI0023688C09|nr:sulfotransferase domain-containing protein [Rhodopirellula sp. P2]WDQ17482.1 sulfotransferase domain-containing protein [Rhodopirellula sp. P2]
MIIPNFVICGAPKAGTSSLHTWIADHPEALGSLEKETYYCVDLHTHMYRKNANISSGLKGYESFFSLKPGTKPHIILESTPAYMYYDTALTQIPDLPSNPKCLFIIREPSQQIYSLFNYFQSNWSWIPAELQFEDYLQMLRKNVGKEQFGGNELAADALKNARYITFLDRWLSKLGPDRMMVRTFDELKMHPTHFVKQIAIWLGLDPAFYDTYHFPRDNETYQVKNRLLQKLNVKIRGKLPKGSAYNAVKDIYRKLNTTTPSTDRNLPHRESLRQLATEYRDYNSELKATFDLDLSGWKH